MNDLRADQARHRGAEMRLRGIPEFGHERMAIEHVLDDAALDALAAAVNQPDLAEAGVVRRRDVFLDDRWNVARGEGVEVERRFDRHPVGHEEMPA